MMAVSRVVQRGTAIAAGSGERSIHEEDQQMRSACVGLHDTETDRDVAALMWDMLLGGIGALGGAAPTRRSVEAWIRAVDDQWPLSFDNVCEAVGLEPDALRTALLATDRADTSLAVHPERGIAADLHDGPLLRGHGVAGQVRD
jgi:hypothetical protein